MSSKDYYKILEVHTNATQHEIKKSFRRLAIQHHPDKNNGNVISEAKFKEIQEAYRTLSDEKKRQEYNRNNFDGKQTTLKKSDNYVINATIILHKSMELKRKISLLDPNRLDKKSLYQSIKHLLSTYNIAIIKSERNTSINNLIVDNVLSVTKLLDYDEAFKICTLLRSFNSNMEAVINKFLDDHKLNTFLAKYKLLFALIMSIVLCVLIYVISKS